MPRSSDAAKAGIGFGTALAIAISWSANHSILWAIIHGILSWVYCPRVLGQWFDGIRFYAAASSPRRSRRTWAGLR